MELTWYGKTCTRLRGRDVTVVNDAYQSVVGATGRGLSGDIATYSHPDDEPLPKPKGRPTRDGRTVMPTSLDAAFELDGPGEYEIHDVLITAVRTFRDDAGGTLRGRNVAFVVELDGVHVIHLGDIGHLLTEERLADIGAVDVACIPIGGNLSATRASELVAQLDPRIVVVMPVCDDDATCQEAIRRFYHEMGATMGAAASRLTVTPSSLPAETTTVLLEPRGRPSDAARAAAAVANGAAGDVEGEDEPLAPDDDADEPAVEAPTAGS